MHQPPPEHTRRPHRHLILGTISENPGQAVEHPGVHDLRKVHQTTPTIRQLKRRHPAQTPHRRTRWIRPTIRPAHRNSPPRHHPHTPTDTHTRITQRLHHHSSTHHTRRTHHQHTSNRLPTSHLTHTLSHQPPVHLPRDTLHPLNRHTTRRQPLHHSPGIRVPRCHHRKPAT
ncbi:hypothetical protein ACF1G7_43495, partial [Streptomyces libani]